jgi:hypothetical protein
LDTAHDTEELGALLLHICVRRKGISKESSTASTSPSHTAAGSVIFSRVISALVNVFGRGFAWRFVIGTNGESPPTYLLSMLIKLAQTISSKYISVMN